MTKTKAVEQVEMISLREITVSSLAGHTVHFEAGVARDVPAFLVAEAMVKGCMPTDQVNLPTESVSGRKATDFTGALRDSLLFLACKQVAENNDSADFAGDSPKGEALGDITGFRVTNKEAVEAHRVYMAAHKSGNVPELHPSADKILMVNSSKTKKEYVELAELFEFPKEDWGSLDKEKLHDYLITQLRKG